MRGVSADDQLRYAWRENSTLYNLRELAYLQNIRRNSAHLHVGVGSGADQRNGNHSDDLLRDQRTIGIARDSRRVLDHFHGIKGNAAHHF